ncbi:MAG: cupin domain-containing protein [Bacteroidales bacterium]|nr:cupin domain-containing protein [Bacteroidales bacterium]
MEKNTPFKLVSLLDYSDSQINHLQVLNAQGGMVFMMALKKGQKLDTHLAPENALVQILEGRVDFPVRGDQHIMKAGDAMLLEPGVEHAVVAVEDTKILLTKIK